MDMRFDRVVRKGYEDDKLVYSLVLDEHGLYIIHTGNIGGLPASAADVNVSSDDAGDPTFVQQLVEQEARIANEPPSVLVHELHSDYVPLQQVTSVEADTDATSPTLTLKTMSGEFRFVFTHDTEEQVSALVDALRAHA
jgi:hypothetical protein